MTAEWRYLIYLYHCGVQGLSPDAPKTAIDYRAVLHLAEKQAVTGIAAGALRRAADCPDDVRAVCTELALSNGLRSALQTDALLSLLQDMERAGLHPVVLKGLSISAYYASPELRSSADADILLPEKEETAVYALLEKQGCQVKRRKPGEHHGSAIHPEVGLIELHIKLWSNRTAYALYGEDAKKTLLPAQFRRVDFQQSEISVLTAQDGAQYLAGHLTRHFIDPGIGIRNAYDFALYLSKNRDALDFDLFWKQMKRYGLDGFVCTVLTFAVRNGLFSAEDFPGLTFAKEESVQTLSEDMARYSTRDEKNSRTQGVWEYYCANHRTGFAQSWAKLTAIRLRDRLRVVFPPRRALQERYPYLERKPYLYPAALAARSFGALKDRRRRSAAKETLTLQNEVTGSADDPDSPRFRTELLHRLDML